MKTAISGFGLIVMLVIAITCQSMIINYSARQEELNSAVNAAMYETQKVLSENSEDIRSEDDYVNVFMTNLLGEGKTNAKYDANGKYKQNGYISSNSKISVKVYTADYENGFLDLAVTETYGYNNSDNTISNRKVTVRRSSIIETIEQDKSHTPRETTAYIKIEYANDSIDFKTTEKTWKDGKLVDDENVVIPDAIDLDKTTEATIKIPVKSGNVTKVSFETEAPDSATTLTWSVENVSGSSGYNKVLVIHFKDIEGNISLKIS